MSAITSAGLPMFAYVIFQLIWPPLVGINPVSTPFARLTEGGTLHGFERTVTTWSGVIAELILKFLALLSDPAPAPAGAASAMAPRPTAITRIFILSSSSSVAGCPAGAFVRSGRVVLGVVGGPCAGSPTTLARVQALDYFGSTLTVSGLDARSTPSICVTKR